MAAQILSMFVKPKPRDWSQQELGEFYRVESALLQAGLRVETDRGLSDEGEPWFVFCRSGDGEVVVHFAKHDGRYIVAGPSYEKIAQGSDFGLLVRDLISRHPLVNVQSKKSNIFLHPTAMLIAVVATALFKSGDAQAASGDDTDSSAPRARDHGLAGSAGSNVFTPTFFSSLTVDARYLAVVTSAAAFVLISPEQAGGDIDDTRLISEIVTIDGKSDATAESTPFAEHNFETIVRAGEVADFDQTAEAAYRPFPNLELLSLATVLFDVAKVWNNSEFHNAQVEALKEIVGVPIPDIEGQGSLLPTIHDMASEGAHSPIIVVKLAKGSGDLPGIQAVSISDHGGDHNKDHSVESSPSSIPAELLPFLEHSVHINASGSALDVLESLQTAGKFDSPQVEQFVSDLKQTGSALASSAAQQEPAQPLAKVASIEIDHDGMLLTSDNNTIVTALEDFVKANHYKTAISGGDIVFYDEVALSSAELSVRSLTWEFTDGSSITLLGPVSHLPMDLMA